MKHTIIRIVVDLLLLSAIFIVPWWLWCVFCLVAVAFIDHHYEIIVIGFLADAALGSGMGGASTNFFFFATTLVLVALSIVLKPRLAFFSSR